MIVSAKAKSELLLGKFGIAPATGLARSRYMLCLVPRLSARPIFFLVGRRSRALSTIWSLLTLVIWSLCNTGGQLLSFFAIDDGFAPKDPSLHPTPDSRQACLAPSFETSRSTAPHTLFIAPIFLHCSSPHVPVYPLRHFIACVRLHRKRRLRVKVSRRKGPESPRACMSSHANHSHGGIPCTYPRGGIPNGACCPSLLRPHTSPNMPTRPFPVCGPASTVIALYKRG